MAINFTDEELDIIFDCLDERRMSSDNEEEIRLIDSIYDKVFLEAENGNS
jgi:hypothetical protein